MKLKVLNKLSLLSLVFFISCTSTEVKYSDPVNLLSDDYWINRDTLQIQVEAQDDDNVPYVMRREKTCEMAKDNIDNVFINKYPEMKGKKYSARIYKILYTEKNNCRLVVHIHMKNLKEVIK